MKNQAKVQKTEVRESDLCQNDAADAVVVSSGSVLTNSATLGSDVTPGNPVCIPDVPSDDWNWCAGPIAAQSADSSDQG